MILERLSGVLAHPTSFPSAFGIGDLGPSAYDFVDFLQKSEQRLWQVLPLGPTSYGDSPYQSFSTFAGNTLLISPEFLLKEGYLTADDMKDPPAFDPRRIDYGEVIGYKDALYRCAFARANTEVTAVQKKDYLNFCAANAEWLDDFVLFTACKHHFIEARKNCFEPPDYIEYKKQSKGLMSEDMINDCYYGAVWNSWPEGLRNREPHAIKDWASRLAGEIEYLKFLQYLFFSQWQALRSYANASGIKIIGDIPIFVAFDSSDVWANRGGFRLDSKGYPTVVAGVPPDYFSETGQLWGNPIYDWVAHKRSGFDWWIRRIKSCFGIYDMLRIDHFRGFDEYWAVKYGQETAVSGTWEKGPGKALFRAIEKKLGPLPIIAEDLGLMTDTVEELRDTLGFPGMRVLQFAFDDTPENVYLPHNYATTNIVVYTGTHDNDTSAGWYAAADEAVRDKLRRYLNVSGKTPAWDLIRLAMSSTAAYAIIPLQDVLSLDTSSRMNTPGTAGGNWQFRYTELCPKTGEGLKYLSKMFNRNAEEISSPAPAEKAPKG